MSPVPVRVPGREWVPVRTVRIIARVAPMVALACVLSSCGSESTEVQGAAEETPLTAESAEGDFSQG